LLVADHLCSMNSVSGCPSKASMTASFKQMRSQYQARYVRIYGACESNHAFYDQIVAAAYEAGVGVYALIWFGYARADVFGRHNELLS